MSSKTTIAAVQYRIQEWAAQIKDCQKYFFSSVEVLSTVYRIMHSKVYHKCEPIVCRKELAEQNKVPFRILGVK